MHLSPFLLAKNPLLGVGPLHTFTPLLLCPPKRRTEETDDMQVVDASGHSKLGVVVLSLEESVHSYS